MKKLTLIPVLLILLFAIPFQLKADERLTKNIKVGAFNAIKVSHAFEVVIRQGTTHSLEITAEEDQFEDIIAKVEGDQLIIRREDNHRDYWKGRRDRVRVSITFKDLEEIDLSGASILYAEGEIKGKDLEIDCSGASKMEMEIDFHSMEVDLSGASVIRLQGQVIRQEVDASGASSYKAMDLESDKAELEASGASSLRVSVKDELNARASGASSIRYKGEPKRFHAKSSSASSVSKN